MSLFTNKLAEGVSKHMIRPISKEEIKVAMFDIGEDKSPGPNGFTSAFFKE